MSLKHGKPLLAAALLLSLLALSAGCDGANGRQELLTDLAAPVEFRYTLHTAARGDITISTTYSAQVRPKDRWSCYMDGVGGKVSAKYAMVGSVVKKGDLLLELEDQELQKRLRQNEIYLRQAEIVLERIANQDAVTREIAQLEYQSVKMAYDEALQNFESTKIYASADGVVSYAGAETFIGAYVTRHTKLFTISDPSTLEAVIPSMQISALQLGQQIELRAQYKQEYLFYKGEVVGFEPISPNQTLGSTVVQITEFPEVEGAFIPSEFQLTVIRDEHKDVIVIPKAMVRFEDGRTFVQVLQNGINRDIDIVIGLDDGMNCEVVYGLKEGDQVIGR